MKSRLDKFVSVVLICLLLVFSIVPKKAEANPLILLAGAGEVVQVASAALGAATGISLYLAKDDLYQLCTNIAEYASEKQKLILERIGKSTASKPAKVTTAEVAPLIAYAQSQLTASDYYKVDFAKIEEGGNFSSSKSVKEVCQEFDIPLAAFVLVLSKTDWVARTYNGQACTQVVYAGYPGGYLLSGGWFNAEYYSDYRDPVTRVYKDYRLRIEGSYKGGSKVLYPGGLITVAANAYANVVGAPIIPKISKYPTKDLMNMSLEGYGFGSVDLPLNNEAAPKQVAYPLDLSLSPTDMPLDTTWTDSRVPYAIPTSRVLELNPTLTQVKDYTIESSDTVKPAEPAKPSISLDWLKDLLGKVIDFLKSILDAILEIPTYLRQILGKIGVNAGELAGAIAGALSGFFDGVKESISAIPGAVSSAISSLFDSVISAVKSIPAAISGLFTSITDVLKSILELLKKFFDVSEFKLDFSKLRLSELKQIFPFCIPFDIYTVLTTFNASSNFSPVINLDTQYFSIHQEIDLTPVMPILAFVRAMEAVFFCIMLYMITKRLIKW
ncbi:hypothetical protein ACLGL1_04530 [Peptococcus simiae]|uniref:hypothetical protein n=1 Tax=Peptococcus simiae TaxID=1643805 RepID=UPI00397FBEFD